MNVIRSNFPLIFENKFDEVVLNPFSFTIFIALGFMSEAKIFSLSKNFEAVTERIPEPVPKSR